MFGLIGKNLGHSFSADFFNEKFEKEGIDNSYRLFPLHSINDFPKLIDENPSLQGLNVTIPYKEEVIKFLDGLSPEAAQIGAVNVIKFLRTPEKLNLIGYNSDCIGFKNSLLPLLNPGITNALVLGTGGASKAIAYVLVNLGIDVSFVSRNPDINQLGYNQLTEELIHNNLLIVNTTPLGMFPDVESYPPIPYQFLTTRHVCYDLVYNPSKTKFMEFAYKFGAKVKNGLEMLHQQALAAWNIWNL